MGSFTEANFAITLADDTPPELLSAFAAFRCGDEDPPELPALETFVDEDDFEPDAFLGSWFEPVPPPVDTLPVAHQGALLRYLTEFSENAYWAGTPSTILRWERPSSGSGHWTLTMRALPKEQAEWVRAIVAPLGRWTMQGTYGERQFVGYLIDEDTPEPVLIWAEGREPLTFTGEFGGG